MSMCVPGTGTGTAFPSICLHMADAALDHTMKGAPILGSAGDLVALQFAAYNAYAEMMDLRGAHDRAGDLRVRARELHRHYCRAWWDESRQRLAGYRRVDGSYDFDGQGLSYFFPIQFGLLDDRQLIDALLDAEITQRESLNVEERSYLPQLLYVQGRHDVAYGEVMTQMGTGLPTPALSGGFRFHWLASLPRVCWAWRQMPAHARSQPIRASPTTRIGWR